MFRLTSHDMVYIDWLNWKRWHRSSLGTRSSWKNVEKKKKIFPVYCVDVCHGISHSINIPGEGELNQCQQCFVRLRSVKTEMEAQAKFCKNLCSVLLPLWDSSKKSKIHQWLHLWRRLCRINWIQEIGNRSCKWKTLLISLCRSFLSLPNQLHNTASEEKHQDPQTHSFQLCQFCVETLSKALQKALLHDKRYRTLLWDGAWFCTRQFRAKFTVQEDWGAETSNQPPYFRLASGWEKLSPYAEPFISVPPSPYPDTPQHLLCSVRGFSGT